MPPISSESLFICSFIHSTSTYALRVHCLPGTLLGMETCGYLGRVPALKKFAVCWSNLRLRLESRCVSSFHQTKLVMRSRVYWAMLLGHLFSVCKHGAATEVKPDFLCSLASVYFQPHLMLNRESVIRREALTLSQLYDGNSSYY